MKSRTAFLFLCIMVVNACSPASQVTVTSEVTVTSTPPPTETAIPTPTLHPQFSALQEQISEIEGYKLTNDGMIMYEGDTIPGVQLTADGRYVVVVGDEMMMVDPEDVHFGEDGEVTIDGYELDENGEWVETMSEAMQAAEQHFADLGYATDGVEFVEGEVTVTGRVDGVKVFEMNIKSGEVMFDQNFAIEQAGQQDLMPTDIEPRGDVLKAQGITAPADRGAANSTYFIPQLERVKDVFFEKFGYEFPVDKSGFKWVLLDPDLQSWGFEVFDPNDPSARRYLYYELGNGEEIGGEFVYTLASGEQVVGGTIIIVPLMPEK